MRFFARNISSPLSEHDRQFVEHQYAYLRALFSNLRLAVTVQKMPTADDFSTLANTPPDAVALVDDCCKLFKVDRTLVELAWYGDMAAMDWEGMTPAGSYEPFLTDLNIIDEGEQTRYRITIARSMEKDAEALLSRLLYELCRIAMAEAGMPRDLIEAPGTMPYFAAIFVGYGAFCSRQLVTSGSSTDLFGTSTWTQRVGLPEDQMAYALGLFAVTNGDKRPDWLAWLTPTLKKALKRSIDFLEIHEPHPITFAFWKERIGPPAYDFHAMEAGAQFRYADAVEVMEEMKQGGHLSDPVMQSNLGYYRLLAGQVQQAIEELIVATQVAPRSAYAHDNLALAYAIAHDRTNAQQLVEKAARLVNDQPGYHLRNRALVAWLQGNMTKADDYFIQALECDWKKPVDLLHYHFAQFLLVKGDVELASKWLSSEPDPRSERLLQLVEANAFSTASFPAV